MTVDPSFQKWATSYSGCDGGDTGEPSRRSIWLCGIEWGGGHSPAQLRELIREDCSKPPRGYSSWQDNLAWIYNWQAMKLLAAIHGDRAPNYKAFAERLCPFVEGSSGFFKMNLYPIAFRNTSNSHWVEAFSEVTGLDSKEDYIAWCEEHRFPAIAHWSATFRPKAILCMGKSLKDQFSRAFDVPSGRWTMEIIEGRELSWSVNANGSVVFVLPFMVNRNGLTKNSTIQLFGERIAEILAQQKS